VKFVFAFIITLRCTALRITLTLEMQPYEWSEDDDDDFRYYLDNYALRDSEYFDDDDDDSSPGPLLGDDTVSPHMYQLVCTHALVNMYFNTILTSKVAFFRLTFPIHVSGSIFVYIRPYIQKRGRFYSVVGGQSGS
jgi:hypothetical protein